eukprot:6278270-Prymnesium_polylepis.1
MPNAARDPYWPRLPRTKYSSAGNMPNAALSLQATCPTQLGILIGARLPWTKQAPDRYWCSAPADQASSGIQIRARTPLDARSRTRIITTTTLLLI